MRLGTKMNPIKLVNESIERPLLVKNCKNSSSGCFDFHALPDFGEDTFVMNVLFNPHLTLPEVRLAIFFHEELCGGGKVYSTSFSDDFVPAVRYGDAFKVDGDYYDGLAFGSADKLKYEIQYANDGMYPSLPMLTASMGMKLTSQRLVNIIRRLHDFGYITVTDINTVNTYRKSKMSSNGTNRARLRHIRLHSGMCSRDLTNRWLPKRDIKKEIKRSSVG